MRMSGYLYPFRQTPTSSQLQAGTTLEEVSDRYVFDRQLRILVLDAVERVEVAIKSQLVTELTTRHGIFAHVDRANLPNLLHAFGRVWSLRSRFGRVRFVVWLGVRMGTLHPLVQDAVTDGFGRALSPRPGAGPTLWGRHRLPQRLLQARELCDGPSGELFLDSGKMVQTLPMEF
jgi:hypothetical protein